MADDQDNAKAEDEYTLLARHNHQGNEPQCLGTVVWNCHLQGILGYSPPPSRLYQMRVDGTRIGGTVRLTTSYCRKRPSEYSRDSPMEDDRGKPSTDGKDFAWRICSHLVPNALIHSQVCTSISTIPNAAFKSAKFLISTTSFTSTVCCSATVGGLQSGPTSAGFDSSR